MHSRRLKQITSFRGEFEFLSNFYRHSLPYKGRLYPTAEHAYQAAKAVLAVDKAEIRRARSPGEAKRLGRKIEIRPDWERVKLDVMRSILTVKFQDPFLRDLLFRTGDAELIESNTWGDREWGQCPLGVGENKLGKLLMEIREQI